MCLPFLNLFVCGMMPFFVVGVLPMLEMQVSKLLTDSLKIIRHFENVYSYFVLLVFA
jgi:hypothetical protein